MATARRLRRPRQGRSPRAPARAPSHDVRARRAPNALPLANALIDALDSEFDHLIAIVMREVDPILLAHGARRDAADLHQDAVSVRELFRLLTSRFNPMALLRRLFAQVDTEVRHATERALPQLSIPAVLSNGTRMQNLWVRQNSDLIVAAEPIKSVVRDVLDNRLKEGVRVEELRAELQERLGMSKRRASLIARDQTLKASGQLQEARQTQVGIRRYVWTTSLDERVRDDHERLEGRVFSWDDPPVTNFSEVIRGKPERRGHPGSDFQCRCTADPVLDDPAFDADELDAGAGQP